MRSLTLWLSFALSSVLVLAEDEAAPAAEEPAAAAEGDAPPAEGDEAAKAQQFADSYQELQDKMGQLNALLAAKGENADPELQERLKSLQSQLAGIASGGMGGGAAEPGSSPELTEFLSGCLVMSMRRAGPQRPATIGALKQLGSGTMTREEASKVDLFKMAAVCITEFTDKDLENFKAGKFATLPQTYATMAQEPKAEKMVTDLDDAIWIELAAIASKLMDEMGGSKEEPVPAWIGMVGMGILFPFFGFLAKKFMDMQKEKETGKKKKEGKKSK